MWKRFFSRQARQPSGWFGRIVASRIFDKGNADLNTLMTQLVDAREDQSILEVGFGTGTVVCELADKVGNGLVEGIDFSDAMLDVARQRNRSHIESGRVRLMHGDFDEVEYPGESFDAVCSANTIYFWPDPAASCDRMYSVLKPGGKVVLAFVDKEKMDDMSLDMDVFHSVSREEVCAMLMDAGFSCVDVHQFSEGKSMYCVVGLK